MRDALKFINKTIGLASDTRLIGAEVGVRSGQNALNMLQSMKLERLYLIDHYIEHYESSGFLVTQEAQDKFYREMFDRVNVWISKICLISKPSVFAASLFPDEFFDFIYIDACHSYESVTEDLKAWFPKIVRQGIISGHDYGNDCTPEVSKAVRDFFAKKDLPINTFGDIDWAVIKTKGESK